MKKILLILLLLFSGVFSQDWHDDDEYVKIPFNLSLWPGISTGDMWAEEAGYKKIYNTGFAFSVIGMRAARLRGADISGIFSIYSEGIQGFQASGIFTLVNGNIRGAQGAGIFTMINGDVKGVQGNGIFGMQNGNFKGVQGSGIFQIQNGDFLGVQASGVFTIQNGDFKGVQVSEVFNITNGDFRGVQAGSALNILSGSFRGLQIGTVNIARYFDSGLQIGIVNIAQEHDGIPVGLFTYVNDVPLGYHVWYDDMQFVNAGLRSGNEDWYNLISVGRRVEGDVRYHTVGAGFGRKIHLGDNWGLDVGISAHKLLDDNFKDNEWDDGDLGAMAKFNLMFRYGLGYEGSLFVGPTITAWYSKIAVEDLSQNPWVDEFEDDHYLRVWPGFVVGLEL
ncbi:MAG: hypothetical protein D8M58_21100 [Calditrichaeota bacterium]|nr:MAG: hypothetical protein DWQ03_16815 [Calditrichota bacterium]MBL1207910.1 hypothetical protein [Calditrichota bacterium]NOG47745.1 hypothetical protein [Calditrichota bacterium]